MSLAELRALAEQEDNQEVETTEEQLELEAQEEETETVDAENEESEEELDDFELEDDEPEEKPKFDAKAALTHKLTKQRKRAQKAESEVEQLRREIDQLKASVGQPQPVKHTPKFEYGSSAPVPPDRWSSDINGDEQKFAQASAQYMSDWNEWQQAQLAPQKQAAKQQSDYQEMVAKKAQLLSDDAASFIQDNKVKPELVISAIETAKEDIDEAAGLDGAFVHLLGSLDSGAAKAAYHIGRNETARNKLKELLASDPSGLKAVNYLTKLTSLKPKTKQSKAPEPDEPIKGNANSVTAERLKSMYDKETDIQKMQKLRKKAREMGVKLD